MTTSQAAQRARSQGRTAYNKADSIFVPKPTGFGISTPARAGMPVSRSPWLPVTFCTYRPLRMVPPPPLLIVGKYFLVQLWHLLR